MSSSIRRIGFVQGLDELLRGRRSDAASIRSNASLLPLKLFVPWVVVLGVTYGFFMGWYGIGSGSADAWMHLLAVMVKLPMLFLGTLFVTFPSLYVFNAIIGCRLGFRSSLRLLVATIVVNLAIAASLGPILGFFTLSTKSYGFMVLLNVLLLAIAGLVSIGFLMKVLGSVEFEPEVVARIAPPTEPVTPPVRRHSMGLFLVWIFTYGIVGAQMGWILRPFIGAPGAAFELFRAREGSFFVGVYNALQQMIGS